MREGIHHRKNELWAAILHRKSILTGKVFGKGMLGKKGKGEGWGRL